MKLSIAGWRDAVWPVGSAIAAAGVTLAGLLHLLGTQTFNWHREQPQFRDAFFEALAMAAVFAITLRVRHAAVRAWLIVAVVALVLRLHAIDFAFLASTYYAVGLWLLGRACFRYRADALHPQGASTRTAVLALTSVGLVLWVLGAFGAGFEASRVAGLLLAGIGWAVGARSAWTDLRGRAAMRPDWITAAALGLCAACLLTVLTRSNTVLYYDSIWYGLRPDRVLFGTHGIFSFLGLTTQVHYYPKLYEVVVAPLYGWGDLSPIIGFNAWTMVLLVAATRALAIGSGVEPRRALVVAVALVCFPAIAGVAETSKGDVLCTAFVLFGARALQRYWVDGDALSLADVLCCALLASALRLSALPWLAALFACTVVVWLARTVRSPRSSSTWLAGRSGIAVVATTVLALLVHARTYLLTGTPLVTNASTQQMFERWGWHLRFPIGVLTGGEAPAGLRGLNDLIGIALRPDEYTFHVIKWLGGIWLGAAIVGLLHACFARCAGWWRSAAIPLAIGLSFPVVLCVNSWPVPGGDGNYFIVPAACLAIVGFSAMRRSAIADVLLVSAGVVGLYVYLLTANWVAGTRAWTLRFDESPFDQKAQIAVYLDSAGLRPVAERFAQCHPLTRVVGMLPETGPAFALPVRFEPLLEWSWNNSASLQSADSVTTLMRATGTQFVLLPAAAEGDLVKQRPELHRFMRGVMDQLVDQGRARVDGHVGGYRMYRYLETAPPRGCTDL